MYLILRTIAVMNNHRQTLRGQFVGLILQTISIVAPFKYSKIDINHFITLFFFFLSAFETFREYDR